MRDRIQKEEIEKWLSKLKKELKMIKAANKKGKEFLDNINAYIHDCEHFKKPKLGMLLVGMGLYNYRKRFGLIEIIAKILMF